MGISINPLSNAIGSEILGADLSQQVSSEDFSAINSAMKKSLVVTTINKPNKNVSNIAGSIIYLINLFSIIRKIL